MMTSQVISTFSQLDYCNKYLDWKHSPPPITLSARISNIT
uniref:Uncharacterized protein n=1 Tax=Anguilla anguilla TaxID=7936 RepID=A0A0E9ST72_ANGAN